MKALSGLDGVFLHVETAQTPMHVASLHLLDLPAGYSGDFHADLQRQVRRRKEVADLLEQSKKKVHGDSRLMIDWGFPLGTEYRVFPRSRLVRRTNFL